VAGDKAGGVTDRFGSRREGGASPEGFSMAEGIGGRENMVASRSGGHRRGTSGWGGSTRWHYAWGGVETVEGGLEWAVPGGSGRPEWNGGGSLDTGSLASACGP
jgi:hypothetical protein